MFRTTILLASLATAALAAPHTTSINNSLPRLDINGQIMDAHDLSLRRLPSGVYVMHTVEYGLCVAPARQGCDQTPDHCGFRGNHNVTVWTSPSLESGSWTPHGNAFEVAARPAGTLYRPDAIFAPATGLWVLWYNLAGVGGNTYATATSPSPFGPFVDHKVTNAFVNEGGDFHLFTDPRAGSADNYLVYTWMAAAPNDHKIRITKLSADFRSSAPGWDTKDDYVFAENFTEAPTVFYRAENKKFYGLFGHCCCFCYQGSGLIVHTADDPLGPWTPQAGGSPDVVCHAPAYGPALGGVPTGGQGCLYAGSNDVSAARAQADFVATVDDGSGGSTYLYFGSRWGQSPDGLKGHGASVDLSRVWRVLPRVPSPQTRSPRARSPLFNRAADGRAARLRRRRARAGLLADGVRGHGELQRRRRVSAPSSITKLLVIV